MKYYRVSESVPFMGGCKFKITDFQNHRARIISDFPASHQGKNTMFIFCEHVPISPEEKNLMPQVITIIA